MTANIATLKTPMSLQKKALVNIIFPSRSREEFMQDDNAIRLKKMECARNKDPYEEYFAQFAQEEGNNEWDNKIEEEPNDGDNDNKKDEEQEKYVGWYDDSGKYDIVDDIKSTKTQDSNRIYRKLATL